jgi:hypothetical protein
MWEMVAKEMGLPWRAIEAIHWQMGPEEMAQRANVPVFQAHNTQRSKSPPPASRANPVVTPTTPSHINTDSHVQIQTQTSQTRQRRSSSSSSRRRANSARQNERPQLAPVSETEPFPTAPTSDPTIGYRSEAAVTPGSSAEWNGSPPSKAIPEERLPPEILHSRGSQSQYPLEPSLIQRSHSHHRTQSETSVRSGEILARAEEKT